MLHFVPVNVSQAAGQCSLLSCRPYGVLKQNKKILLPSWHVKCSQIFLTRRDVHMQNGNNGEQYRHEA